MHPAESAGRLSSELLGERKHVTVLFADVKGSMDLAGSLDPEEWRAIMDRFVRILSAGVHRFDGTVDKFTGDGIMALFGAPIAYEDHALRSCHAALHLRKEIDSYSSELRRVRGLDFSVRMGLNSGEVVLGTLGDDSSLAYTAIGHTVGLAQRMESLARPGTVYLAGSTASLVEGFFELADCGEFEVKGVDGPLHVYELEGIGPLHSRIEIAEARGLTPLVGRSEEMAELVRAWERSVGGEAQVVGLEGEAGIGKSRLCHEFVQRLRNAGVRVTATRALSHERTVPFAAFLGLLRDYFAITDADEDQAVRQKVADRALSTDPALADALPAIWEFLGARDPEAPWPEMSPELRQRRLFDAISRLQRAQGTQSPGVILVEDLHWLDPASETFLKHVVETLPGTGTLLLTTFRPGYRAEWMQGSHYGCVALAPLDAKATEELLTSLLGTDPSLDGLAELIRARVGGNPFFIEEIVRGLAEQGVLIGEPGDFRLSREVGQIAMPPTVQSVLAARIDRLPAREKSVLQTASVIGREFSDTLLARVAGLSHRELQPALRALVSGEFLHQATLAPTAEYIFKHAHTEEVAYRSQLAERRAKTHRAVAQAVEELEHEHLDERAALIAHHWDLARDQRRAAQWSARAATWAGFTDQLETVRHWRKVREHTVDAEDAELAALGLTARALLLAFAWRLGSDTGLYDDIEALLTEGEALADQLGNQSLKALLLGAYGPTKLVSGDLQGGLEVARRAMALAVEADDLGTQLMIVPGIAYPLFLLGDVRASLAVTEGALERAAGDRSLGAGLGWTRPFGWAEMWRAYLVAWSGRLADGRAYGELALQASREEGDVENQLWIHTVLVQVAELEMDDPAFAFMHARSACELAEGAGGVFGQALAHSALGVAYMLRGEWEPAIEAIESSLALSRERHSALDVEAWHLARLARARLGYGDAAGAHTAASQAVERALERHARLHEIPALIELARARIATEGADASAAVTAELERALTLVGETGAGALAPQVRLAFAELARAAGDEGRAARNVGESRRLLAAMTVAN